MKKILLFGLYIFALIISSSAYAEDSSFTSSSEHNNTAEQQRYSFDELHFIIPFAKPERINDYIVLGLEDTLYVAREDVAHKINDYYVRSTMEKITNDKVTYPSLDEDIMYALNATRYFEEKRKCQDGKKIYGSAFPKKYFSEINDKVGSNIWLYLELVDEFFKCSDNIVANAPKVITDNTSVKEVQQLLNYLGYKAGSEDGVFGLTTAEALVEFGQANKIEHASLGFITDSVLVELRNCKELNKCFVEK